MQYNHLLMNYLFILCRGVACEAWRGELSFPSDEGSPKAGVGLALNWKWKMINDKLNGRIEKLKNRKMEEWNGKCLNEMKKILMIDFSLLYIHHFSFHSSISQFLHSSIFSTHFEQKGTFSHQTLVSASLDEQFKHEGNI